MKKITSQTRFSRKKVQQGIIANLAVKFVYGLEC